MIGKISSLIVAGIYLTAVYLSGDREALFWLIFELLFVLACIWYADEMGNFFSSGFGGHGIARIDQPSPAFLVRFMGWVLLLLPFLLIPIALLVTTR